jgi:hypothetical protein
MPSLLEYVNEDKPMKITPSPHYLPYSRSAFEIPTLNQAERLHIHLSDDDTTNMTIVFYSESGTRQETVVPRADFTRVAEAIKILDPFRNI